MYKISIIIPVYGVEDYIEKCINSILSQTLKELQVIVVDDSTKDKSIDKIENLIKNHHRKEDFTIIKKNNEGVSFARKIGFQYVKGEYVIYIDSDDYYVSDDVLEILYNEAKKKDLDLVIADYIEKEGDREFKMYKNIPENISNQELVYFFITENLGASLWTILIKKKAHNNIFFDKNINIGEDLIHIVQLILNSKKISYLKIPVVYYIYRYNSITNSKNIDETKAKQLIMVVEYILYLFNKNNIYNYEVFMCLLFHTKRKILKLNYTNRKNIYMEVDDWFIKSKKIKLHHKIDFFLCLYIPILNKLYDGSLRLIKKIILVFKK